MPKKNLKILVLGFDGASPKLVDRWIDYLPTFEMFKRRGIFGQTIPPIPAQTPVAWTSFMTGNNPGKHGIFSFALRRRGTYEREIIGPRMVKSKTLWEILTEANKKVGIVNVPMTDTEKLNGFIVPGFLSMDEGVPHPNRIRKMVEQKFGINKIAGDLETEILKKVETDPDLFFERVNQITDEMAEITFYLLQEEPWDFFMAVFMGLDRIQHFFWKHIDVAHPGYENNEYSEFVKDFYIKADKIMQRFIKSVDEDTLVVVVSDHGFCPIYKEVIVNNYLEELGFLKARKRRIDLEKSKAISYGYGDLWLNVKGREPKGIINQKEYENTRDAIIEELVRISVDHESPIKAIKRREELYWGACLEAAPDLTIIFNVGWQAARRPEITDKNELKRYVNDNPRWSGGHDGAHDPKDVPGILGIMGPEIQSRQEIKIYLRDITPTLLKLMKVPIATEMDGQPLDVKAQLRDR